MWREVGEEEGVHDRLQRWDAERKVEGGRRFSLEMLKSILCANVPLKESVSLRAVG